MNLETSTKHLNGAILKKSKGLGDIVEDITTATGIKRAVKWIAGEDCGCDERKEKLNKLIIFKREPADCLQEDEYQFLTEFFSKKNRTTITHREQIGILGVYNRVFNKNMKINKCGSCVRKMIDKLKTVYATYQT